MGGFMRAILFLAFVVLILMLVGWVTFSADDSRSSINLETQEIKEDTQKVLDSGATLLDKAGDELNRGKTPDGDK
jgi:hypothetical protein